jgi:hypothetical protein
MQRDIVVAATRKVTLPGLRPAGGNLRTIYQISQKDTYQ